LFFTNAAGTDATLVDINTSTSSSPTGLTTLGNVVFFAATQGGVGNELFYFNPVSEVLTLGANIDGAATSSSPQYITNAYGDLYFSATTPANGREVHKWSNGNVSAVGDINPGAGSSTPLEFKVVASDLVFFADDGTNGTELWKVDLANTPTIAPISAKNIDENLTLSFSAFINSAISSTANLTLTGSALDTNLVGSNGFSFSGTGTTRTVNITPKDFQNGTTTITLQVCDNASNCISTTFSLTVNSVNNAPVISDVNQRNVNEDNSLLFSSLDFTGKFFDADGTTIDSIRIESLPNNGKLSLGADTIKNSDLPRKIRFGIIGTLRYTPNANYNGKDTAAYNAFSGGDWATTSKNIIVTINSINDIPTIVSIVRDTLNEDGSVSFNSNKFINAYQDVESSPLASIRINYLPPNGVLLSGNDTLTFLDLPKTVLTANISTISYHPDTNYNGLDFILWRAGDGVAFSIADTMYLRVNAVNDLPTSSAFTVSVNEDNTYTFNKTTFDAVYKDIETATLSRVMITSLPVNGTLKKNNSSVSVNQVLRRIQLDSLKFSPNLNFNGTVSFDVKFKDAVAFSSASSQVNVTVNPVNDAPISDKVSFSASEDVTFNLSFLSFKTQISDIESDTLVNIQITSLPSNGSLTFNGSTLTSGNLPLNVIGDSVEFLAYRGTQDFNGTDVFKWKAFDGSNYSLVADTVQMSVSPVNDAPIVYNFAQSTDEDMSVTIFRKDFTDNYTDVDGDTIVHLTFTSLPRNGKVLVSGVEQTATPFNVTLPNLDAVTYSPNPNFNKKDTVNFTGFDGNLNSSNSARIVFTVNPTNDTTIISAPGQQTILENTATTVAGISLSDIDVDDGDVTVTLSSDNGFITLSTVVFLSFQNGDGNGDTSMTFSGSLARVNNALNNLVYKSSLSFLGLDFIRINVSDPGPGTLATDNAEIQILVQDRPVSFITNPTNQVTCEGNDVTFSVSVDGTAPFTYQWQFDGVDIAGENQATLTVSSIGVADTGNYTCKVFNKALNDSVSLPGNLDMYFKANTNFGYSESCTNAPIQFTDSSTVIGSTVASFSWGFGDGSSSANQNPIHTYFSPNTYSVRLITTTGQGCLDTTFQSVVATPTPTSSFSISTECEGDTTRFTNNSTALYGNLTYEWSFGNNDSSTQTSPSYLYDTILNYQAVLTVKNDNKCATTSSTMVNINPRPRVKFNTTTVCNGESTNFNNSSKLLVGTMSYTWKYGDGNNSNNTNPTYTYLTADTFNVELFATSDKGCSDSLTKISIVKPFPIVSFTSPNECGVDSVMFSNNTTITKRGFMSYWDFNDGNDSTVNGNINYLYQNPGTYNVQLKVVADEGCADSVQQSVTVYPMPNISFSSPTVCLGEATNFGNTSNILTGNQTYVWDYDDSNTSSNTSPTYTYLTADTFNVELFATSDRGCVDSLTQMAIVKPFPIVSFTSPNECEVDSVMFSNNTTITKRGFMSYWDFNDGNDSTINGNINYLYQNPGTYNVQLKVVADEGCADSVQQSVTVYPIPNLSFVAPSVCFGNTSNFSNTSNILSGVVSYNWDFNDGNFSNNVSPKNNFAVADTFDVELFGVSDKGCIDSLTQEVIVHPFPIVNFSAANECDGDSITFMNNTNISRDGFSSYWNFGNQTDTTQNGDIKYLYNNAAVYSVELVVTADAGCSDSITKNVTVYPVAFVTATSVDVACFGDPSGSISINPLGGTPPFQYSIDSGATYASNNVFNGLFVGNYYLTTTDVNGCVSDFTSNPMAVNKPTPLVFGIDSVFNVSCFEGSNGLLEGLASGGTSPYLYSIDSLNFQTSNVFGGLMAQNFRVVLKDANNCVTHIDTLISEPSTPISLSFTFKNILCNSDSTGQIVLTGLGSVGNYLYSIDGGSNLFANGTFNNLGAGQYAMTVIDSNGCDTIQSINLTQPSTSVNLNVVSSSDVKCFGDNSGSIQVAASGGTGFIRYGINSKSIFSAATNFANLNANTYMVYSRDFNGCLDSVSVPINQPQSALVIDSISSSDLLCFNTPSGNIQLFGVGGTPGYSYRLSSGQSQTSNSFVVSKGGAYLVQIIDSNNCIATDTVNINEPAQLVVNVANVTNENCEFEGNGSIELNATGGTNPFEYSLNNVNYSSNNTIGNLTNGNYVVYIKDANNCISLNNATVASDTLLPVALFSQFRAGNTVSFINQSTNQNKVWWNFGDGETSNTDNPVHLYKNSAIYSVTLAANNGCGGDTLIKTIDVNSTGIDQEIFNNSMSIYPNPAVNNTTISIDPQMLGNGISLKVINGLGQLVLFENNMASGNKINLNLTDLANGIYYVELSGDKQTFTKNLIINK
jgi:ELWxxDGT repeat protein